MTSAVEACYFIATILLILGLKRMSSPRTARSGILWAGGGMALAIVATFFYPAKLYSLHPHLAGGGFSGHRIVLILVAIAVGGVPAWWSGRKIAITNMPQMVAIYNGLGGGAAAAIAAVEFYSGHAYSDSLSVPVIAVAGALAGTVAFGGSAIAFAKLQGWMKSPRFRGRQVVNSILLAIALLLGVCSIFPSSASIIRIPEFWTVTLFFPACLIVGILITLPIGGADMPVIISTYNACIGLAVGFEGYVMQNPAMMILGTIVGAAGTLLTLLMAKAMNRSFAQVWLSDFGDVEAASAGGVETRTMQAMEPSDAAATMAYSEQVIIVPGYGLAVAQAQHKLWDFAQLLQKRGVKVRFAIHPVAGRMPGHMSVLMAEAGVPYDLIFDLDEINADFANTDVALVIGANDVVNPAARTEKSSPIYGMPILNVDQARQVLVIKRGKGAGFSGVQNELFFSPNTHMVFGDAQDVINKMIQSLREL
ncbi:MAG: NAD(P)(+) transhydrogenase (Re/Si-specific) subunit beta [Terriglobia bacterium]